MSHEIIKKYLDMGLLISPDLLAEPDGRVLDQQPDQDSLIINADLKNALSKNPCLKIDWREFERSLFLQEKKGEVKLYRQFLTFLTAEQRGEETQTQQDPSPVRIVLQDTDEPHKRSVDDFISYFNTRFNYFEKLLKTR